MTVAQLSESMTAAEEAHWIAFSKFHPFGEERADMRSAQICQILWNSNVSKKEQTKKLTDFLLFRRKERKADPNIGQSVRNVFQKLANRKGKQ